MSSIHFEHPYLLLLFPLALLCLKLCPQKEDSLLFSNTKLLSQSIKKVSLIEFFKLFTLLFLTLAISSPYTFKKYEKVDETSIALSLIVDLSLSMKEEFPKVKKSLKKFIKKRDGDLISLIYFADSVAVASPFTKDNNFILKSLENIKVGELGEMDTHLYDALMLSNSLKTGSLKSVKVLLTDGIDKGSKTSLEELVNSLKEFNSTIYTIGYGEDFDERVLKALAKKSDGEFFKADMKTLDENLKKLDNLYPKQSFQEIKSIKEQLYQLPLFLAFLSLLFYTYLLNKRAVV